MNALRYLALVLLAAPLAAQPAFEEVPGAFDAASTSWGASWVDYDGDGRLDLFVNRTGASGGNLLFRHTGDGFEPVEAGALTDDATPGSLGSTWADFDNDGDLDAYAVGGYQGTGAGRLFRNDGGTFSVVAAAPVGPAEDNRGWSAAWGDFDADGLVDLVVAHPQGFVGPSQPNHLFRNTGDGTFARVTDTPITDGLAPYTIPSWSDYDLDGDLDLFIGSGPISSAGPDHLYENLGGGAFARITTDPIATDLRDGQVMNWVDYDNDGDLDLYVTSYGQATNMLYRNDSPDGGAGPYVEVTDTPLSDPVESLSLANAWGDFDNDGDLDVLVGVSRTSTSQTGYNRLYLNDGDGSFTSLEGDPLVATAESTSGLTVGDYDGDGDLDVATTSSFSGTPNVRLYRNTTANGNGWLKLDLVGTASNRSAIGARVRVTATIGGEAVVQLREVSAQNTFGGQNALTVHVGLGDAASASAVEVTWPSGAVEVFEGLPANAHFVVTEGEGIVPVANEPGGLAGAAMALEAFPNPFATTATLRYTLDAPAHVRLTVYDVLGRHVATLADASASAGIHTAAWDGTDASGRALGAGLYLVRLKAGGEALTRRLTLLR